MTFLNDALSVGGELSDHDIATYGSRLNGSIRSRGVSAFSDLGGGGTAGLLAHGEDVHTVEQCNALVVQYQTWTDKLEDEFEAIRAPWAAKTQWHTASEDNPDEFASDLAGLKERIKTASGINVGAASTARNLLTYIPFLNSASASNEEYGALIKAIRQNGEGAAPIKGDLSDLVSRLGAAQKLLNKPATGLPPSNPVPGNLVDGFYKEASDPNSLLGKANVLGRTIVEGGKKGDPWWTDPFANPWVQGAAIIAAIGVVGFTIGEVRALLPAGPR